ncbi:hypothetical protein L7F22_060229 [Adiantum nelumboides]|nr:hypothetical protein [Adiantum nelumboides]
MERRQKLEVLKLLSCYNDEDSDAEEEEEEVNDDRSQQPQALIGEETNGNKSPEQREAVTIEESAVSENLHTDAVGETDGFTDFWPPLKPQNCPPHLQERISKLLSRTASS